MPATPRAYETVERLLAEVNAALSAAAGDDMAAFVERTERYLQSLEQWQDDLRASGEPVGAAEPERKEAIKALLAELEERHQILMTKADEAKAQVGDAMGEMHRRASGLRKYVDHHPSRITITGKRKG